MLQKAARAFSRVSVAILCLSALVAPGHGQAQVRPLITEHVDESRLITLAGNQRPEARAENDRGPVADSTSMEHLLLQLRRAPEQEQALSELIEQLHTPTSPNFHRWLTAQQLGERFGPAQELIYYSLAASEYGNSGSSSCNSTLGMARPVRASSTT